MLLLTHHTNLNTYWIKTQREDETQQTHGATTFIFLATTLFVVQFLEVEGVRGCIQVIKHIIFTYLLLLK